MKLCAEKCLEGNGYMFDWWNHGRPARKACEIIKGKKLNVENGDIFVHNAKSWSFKK